MSGFEPLFLEPGGPIVFPDPRLCDAEGLVAVGGDLSQDRLLFAYRTGIFPWFSEETIPFWWSPDPRCVLPAKRLHVSRSLRRRLRHRDFELTWNRAFRDVMRECSRGRPEGTWITAKMHVAYSDLHDRSHAHSLEVWREGELVGGIYGVQVGGLFAAESMFHRLPDMSKIALAAAVHSLSGAGIELFDVQFWTEHLARMGAVDWPRDRYLSRLEQIVGLRVDLRELEITVP